MLHCLQEWQHHFSSSDLPDGFQAWRIISNNAGFTVWCILLHVMAEKSSPVCLKRIMNRMPVPVHHTVCTACQMTVCLKSELSFIRSPSRITLCFCFQNKIVISSLKNVSYHRQMQSLPLSDQSCVGWIISVPAIVSAFAAMVMVYIRLYSIGISPTIQSQN